MTLLARAGVGLVIATAAGAQVGDANATYPGGNGKILFVGSTNERDEGELFVINPDGSGRTNLTEISTAACSAARGHPTARESPSCEG
jgi:hypothetical protein